MVPVRWGGDTKALATAIRQGWTVERLTALLPVYFASEDRLIRDNGYRAADFVRTLAGLESARKEGRTHGSATTAAHRDAGRSSNLIRRGDGKAAAESWERRRQQRAGAGAVQPVREAPDSA
jgi:hypothetical protein